MATGTRKSPLPEGQQIGGSALQKLLNDHNDSDSDDDDIQINSVSPAYQRAKSESIGGQALQELLDKQQADSQNVDTEPVICIEDDDEEEEELPDITAPQNYGQKSKARLKTLFDYRAGKRKYEDDGKRESSEKGGKVPRMEDDGDTAQTRSAAGAAEDTNVPVISSSSEVHHHHHQPSSHNSADSTLCVNLAEDSDSDLEITEVNPATRKCLVCPKHGIVWQDRNTDHHHHHHHHHDHDHDHASSAAVTPGSLRVPAHLHDTNVPTENPAGPVSVGGSDGDATVDSSTPTTDGNALSLVVSSVVGGAEVASEQEMPSPVDLHDGGDGDGDSDHDDYDYSQPADDEASSVQDSVAELPEGSPVASVEPLEIKLSCEVVNFEEATGTVAPEEDQTNDHQQISIQDADAAESSDNDDEVSGKEKADRILSCESSMARLRIKYRQHVLKKREQNKKRKGVNSPAPTSSSEKERETSKPAPFKSTKKASAAPKKKKVPTATLR